MYLKKLIKVCYLATCLSSVTEGCSESELLGLNAEDVLLGPSDDEDDTVVPEEYQYSYGVLDSSENLEFSAAETKAGSTTTGEYSVMLPDGRRQTVSYTDAGDGVRMRVIYDSSNDLQLYADTDSEMPQSETDFGEFSSSDHQIKSKMQLTGKQPGIGENAHEFSGTDISSTHIGSLATESEGNRRFSAQNSLPSANPVGFRKQNNKGKSLVEQRHGIQHVMQGVLMTDRGVPMPDSSTTFTFDEGGTAEDTLVDSRHSEKLNEPDRSPLWEMFSMFVATDGKDKKVRKDVYPASPSGHQSNISSKNKTLESEYSRDNEMLNDKNTGREHEKKKILTPTSGGVSETLLPDFLPQTTKPMSKVVKNNGQSSYSEGYELLPYVREANKQQKMSH